MKDILTGSAHVTYLGSERSKKRVNAEKAIPISDLTASLEALGKAKHPHIAARKKDERSSEAIKLMPKSRHLRADGETAGSLGLTDVSMVNHGVSIIDSAARKMQDMQRRICELEVTVFELRQQVSS